MDGNNIVIKKDIGIIIDGVIIKNLIYSSSENLGKNKNDKLYEVTIKFYTNKLFNLR